MTSWVRACSAALGLATAVVLGVVAGSATAQADPETVVSGSASCDVSTKPIVCTLQPDGDGVGTSQLVDDLKSYGVTPDTPIWAQAWGGYGHQGDGSGYHAPGGAGGFTQTVFRQSQLQSKYGSTTLFYYLGEEGALVQGWLQNAGGGGSSTVLSGVDLSQVEPSIENVVLLSGGGGGGAGENDNVETVGQARGGGGIGIARRGVGVQASGGQGLGPSGASNHSGAGGECPQGGYRGDGKHNGAGDDGGTGWGGPGGAGGTYEGGRISALWQNYTGIPTYLADGYGGTGTNGSGFYEYPGAGGGGGGWGGGGGGGTSKADTTTYAAGGGGGGCSYASAATLRDPLAPKGYVPIPSTFGTVHLVFNTAAGAPYGKVIVPRAAKPGDSGTLEVKVDIDNHTKEVTGYPSGGVLTGLWDAETSTMTTLNGHLRGETGGGKPLPERLSFSNGTLEPITDDSDSSCPEGSEYEMAGDVAAANVPQFGLIWGNAVLCGQPLVENGDGGTDGATPRGSPRVPGETFQFSGEVDDINSPYVEYMKVEDLVVRMVPDIVAKARSPQRVGGSMSVKVGCLDQGCKFRLAGKARVPRSGGATATAPVRTRKLKLSKGERRKVQIRLSRGDRAARRIARLIGASRHARRRAALKVRVKALGERGSVGHARANSRLRP